MPSYEPTCSIQMNLIFVFVFNYFLCIDAGHANAYEIPADEFPAEVPAGGTLLSVGSCSKFADCNKYCQDNYSRIFGGICKALAPGGEIFCFCKV